MENLLLYTQDYFLKGQVKAWAKKILGRSFGGPAEVSRSLRLGLSELGTAYKFNSNVDKGRTAGVLSGPEVLAWAIKQKKAGNFLKILAGPNLVVLPQDAGGVLLHPAVDAIIVPCLWVKKAYEKNAPTLAGKIFIWAAGVDLPELTKTEKTLDFLIFNKFANSGLAKSFGQALVEQGYKIQILSYGEFKQADYFNWLNKSRALIQVGQSESQGISMFEAWARNVPTLVYGSHDNTGTKPSPSPYLTAQTGRFFQDLGELKKIAPDFLQMDFSPRQYVAANFSHKKSAEKYLEIVTTIS